MLSGKVIGVQTIDECVKDESSILLHQETDVAEDSAVCMSVC
jgi:hypothetical protein